MSYGLNFSWVENDPTYRDGFTYLVLDSSKYPSIFASISKQWKSGIFNRKYFYILRMAFRDAETGREMGGYYDSLEEAKAMCSWFMKSVFYDPRDDHSIRKNKQ